jgi:hypothetical protein
MLTQGSLHAQADTSPNICCGLLLESLSNDLPIVFSILAIRGESADIVTYHWLPESNILDYQCLYIARRVNDTSSSSHAISANINTDEMVTLEIQVLGRTISGWPISKHRRMRVPFFYRLTPLISALKIANAAPQWKGS